MFIKEYISTLKIVCIFSNLFDSEHVGSPIINQLTGVAMEKSSSYIPTSKVNRSCSYRQKSLKTSIAF